MARSNEGQIITHSRFRLPGSSKSSLVTNNPNQWFSNRFPDAALRYGPAFMETSYADPDGLMHFIPAFLNDDFFSCILGGDSRLGHHVVYCPSENTFYVCDYAVDAYCPTSKERLKLLLSHYLIRC